MILPIFTSFSLSPSHSLPLSLSSLVYRRKAMLHHYTSYMEADLIAAADQQVGHILSYTAYRKLTCDILYIIHIGGGTYTGLSRP